MFNNTLKNSTLHKVDRLLDEALELPASERSAFLDEACAHEPEIRRQVEELLELETKANSFMSTTQPLAQEVESAIDRLERERSPKRGFGPYRVVREIGQGGMGRVYLAERADGQFHRRVAIKVIRGSTDSDEIQKRFEQERRILAGLQHPNIAQLLDSGVTVDGLPYFVMEYVEGEPIDVYCDKRKLNLGQRLKLFEDVCAALQYAHQNLVVHRDIKPNNILVKADGQIKLLDFGIAKILNSHLRPVIDLTRTGQTFLTPECASPEQVLGAPITTASDIYALGNLLYFLLAGRWPISVQGSSPHQWIQAIAHSEPRSLAKALAEHPAPQTLAENRSTTLGHLRKELGGDLDCILMKALRKETSHRYVGVGAFLDDLINYRTGMPVRARAGNWRYRALKFSKRHLLEIAFLATIAALGFALIVSTTIQSTVAERERDKAERVSAFLQEMLRSVDPGKLGRDIKVAEFLDRAALTVDDELAGQPETHGVILRVLGETYHALGRYDRAKDLFTRALFVQRGYHGDRHPEVLATLNRMAMVLERLGKLREAEKVSREAMAHHPVPEKWSSQRFTASQTLGKILMNEGRYLEATRILEPLPRQARIRYGPLDPLTLDLTRSYAAILVERSKLDEAESIYREIRAKANRIWGPEHPKTLAITAELSRFLVKKGAYDEAEELSRDNVAVFAKILGETHPDALATKADLVSVLHAQGKWTEALELISETKQTTSEVLGADHPLSLSLETDRARVLESHGKFAEAESIYRAVLTTFNQTHGPNHPTVFQISRYMAIAIMQQGRFEEAEQVFRETLAKPGAKDVEHPDILGLANDLATVLEKQGRFEESEQIHRQTLKKCGVLLGESHPFTLESMGNLAAALMGQGRYQEAEALQRKIIEGERETIGEDHPSFITTLNNLAVTLNHLDKRDEAIPLLRKVMLRCREIYGPDHLYAFGSMNNLAAALREEGRFSQAEPLQREAYETSLRILGKDHPYTKKIKGQLITLLNRTNREEEALLL